MLEMDRAWNDAMRLLRASRDVILVVAGVFFFLPYFAFMLLTPDPLAGLARNPTPDNKVIVARLWDFYSHVWWIALIVLIVQAIGMIGLIALLTDRRRPTVAEALAIGARRVLPYIAAYLLVGFALAVVLTVLAVVTAATGFAAMAVVAIVLEAVAFVFLFVRFSLVAPVVAKEDVANPLTALGRSWALTRGNGWRLLAFFFLLALAYVVLAMVISLVTGTVFSLLGQGVARFGDALVTALLNAGWATVFLAILSAIHDQLAGPARGAPGATSK
jgi:hypothetical protein